MSAKENAGSSSPAAFDGGGGGTQQQQQGPNPSIHHLSGERLAQTKHPHTLTMSELAWAVERALLPR